MRDKEVILNTIRETSERDFSVTSITAEDFKIIDFDFLNDS